MAKNTGHSGSAAEVLALFDEEERKAFLDEFDVAEEDVPSRFAPSRLLRWIAQRRSPFIRMAGDIGSFLNRVENAIRGNIDFLVTERQGRDLEFHFGPQVRQCIAAALSLADAGFEEIDEKLDDLRRSVHRFCQDVRPRLVRRDSSLGRTIRDMSRTHPNPVEQMKFRMQADLLKRSHSEFNPHDVALIHQLAEEFDRQVPDIEAMGQPDSADLSRIVVQLRQLRSLVREAARRAAARRSREWPPPGPNIDERTVTIITGQLAEFREAVEDALRLERTSGGTFEAMALDLWKERWRLYELWLLCTVCTLLARLSDSFDLAGRVADGRWTLKFTHDATPVLSALVGGRHLDLYYQYFQPGEDRANMPDVAVRDRESMRWLIILDPKSGLSFTRGSLSKVCLRYSEAFDAELSAVANYYPDEPSVDRLSHPRPAILFHGLRPENVAALIGPMVEALRVAGIVVRSRTVVALVDVSGSMATHRLAVAETLAARLRRAGDLEQDLSRVAFFAEDWVEDRTIEAFLEQPAIDHSGGGNDYRAAVARAIDHVQPSAGQREVWLFGDGADDTQWEDLVERCVTEGIRFDAFIFGGGGSKMLEAASDRTGGQLIQVT